MATSDNNGPDTEAVEGSWSPKRSRTAAEKKAGRNGSPDPEVLAEEIEKTREELAETLDAIADKVSPKRVAGRTKKAAKDGAADAVDSVKETAAGAAQAVKAGVAKAKERSAAEPAVPLAVAEVPVEVAPTPGTLADAEVTARVPAGAEAPVHTSTLPPAAPSRAPLYAGAGAAALVALLLLRRRRR